MKQTTKELSNIAAEINRLAINAELTDDTDRFSQLVLAADINLKALALSKLSMRILHAKGELKTDVRQYVDDDCLMHAYDDKDDEPIENTARVHLDDLKVKPASVCTSEELQRRKAAKDDDPIIPPTTKIVNMIPFELYQFVPYGSDIRCTRPTKDREYVRILAACRGKFLTVKHIFPNVENPSRYELITLQKLGYLQRYTQPEYVTARWRDGKPLEARKVWFKTTPKGEELLRKVGV